MRFLVKALLLCVSCALVPCSPVRDKMMLLQRPAGGENETLLVITWVGDDQEEPFQCEVFTDKHLIQEIMTLSGKTPEKPSEEEMKNILEDCTEISRRRKRRQSGDGPDVGSSYPRNTDNRENVSGRQNNRHNTDNGFNSRRNNNDTWNDQSTPDTGSNGRSSHRTRNGERERYDAISNTESSDGAHYSSRENDIRDEDEIETTTFPGEMEGPKKVSTTTEGSGGWPVIFPGTKWCGAGDIAKNYDDLGLHQDTDRCCRAHDLCDDLLVSGETRNNLTNKSPFTKLSCKCDQDFYNCLDRVNTVTSNTIGNMYFNILKRECYEKDYPVTKKCKKYRSFLKIKCEEYEKDKSKGKVYQWVPAKKYKKIPFPGPLTITLPF